MIVDEHLLLQNQDYAYRPGAIDINFAPISTKLIFVSVIVYTI
jgi:hypothetical protein